MEQQYNRRKYQRGTHFNLTVGVSLDNLKWYKARASDLSSGGLSLLSEHDYSIGDTMWFDLRIEGFLSEFEVKTKGTVRRKEHFANENVYGIEFIGLPPDIKIRIDESVRADRPVEHGSYEID